MGFLLFGYLFQFDLKVKLDHQQLPMPVGLASSASQLAQPGGRTIWLGQLAHQAGQATKLGQLARQAGDSISVLCLQCVFVPPLPTFFLFAHLFVSHGLPCALEP